ncbi:DUF2680 domain-containing protein [Desulforamulus hydrothermalis]|uniref:DUF2680 domain-containing protein n=1 Tax=Desulforamulus hydrothermalis Lam5 = DSM 18033 TaxID=1121428 RepID=K8DY09_9FIRM|nr:DUF2680 domain-containing protein [Desulforamulus hydrothermalis]CCO07652.1 conserved exported hypothetical protein [Desulforamulus hydrothermalis Lam5 = DSM 18033]SHH24583.1 Protein of unknown function [Desulforamulus hydrothermalis Lam5 = DSM 18033]
MNKRLILVGLLIMAVIAFTVPTAFAADDVSSQAKAWFDQKFAAKKAWVEQAVKNGQLTPEQGQAWQQHFDQMKEWHAKNGYICPGGGQGCFGKGPGMGGGRWMNRQPVQPQT